MITKNQIEHLAKLARLKLSEVEVENLSKDLTEILTYVEKINEINLENVEPLTNILDKLDLREDNHQLTDNSLIIENFPEKEDDYLKVPKILEKE
jgi:aspartyl-tRNA(Asn)/glutamyl-tRNA(Gln) amidotransferase subunit C